MIRSPYREADRVMIMRVSILAGAIVLCSSFAVADQFARQQIVLPVPDAERGRFLFASKGCVVCHSINGVGGKAGPALDAKADDGAIDPLEFAARMWRGAGAMAILQSMEFGYQIEMSGEEIADLAAFTASRALQSTFSEKDVPEVMRGWTVDEPIPAIGEEWPGWGPDDDLASPEDANIGNLSRGHMLAERWCTSCHVVDLEGEGGDVGPAFVSIASRPDVTEKSIRDWLSVPHTTMPEFLNLVETDFNDIASYIMSLKP
jgi:mono/diheme cytochrome c family protein